MFINVLTQVLILLILIVLGAILTKAKVLTEQGVKSMTDTVLLIVTPCVIIKSFVREFNTSVLKNLIISFLIAFVAHIVFILLAKIMLRDKNKARERVLQFGAIFSNCGFMSIPLQQALLGEEGVFYCASYVAIFNLFIWSYGLISMSGDKSYLKPRKLFLSPGIIGLSVGLIIFLFSVPIPKIILEPISYMASLNTPVPMIIIGYHLMQSNILDGLTDLKGLYAMAVKLVVFPLIALGGMYICGIRGTMLVSSVITCSAPTAAITTMFAAKYGADTSLSVNMVSLSTVLSLITMPLVITLAQYVA